MQMSITRNNLNSILAIRYGYFIMILRLANVKDMNLEELKEKNNLVSLKKTNKSLKDHTVLN